MEEEKYMSSQANFAITEQKVACSTKKQNKLKILEYGAHEHTKRPTAGIQQNTQKNTHTHISTPGLRCQRESIRGPLESLSVSEDTDKTR